MATAQVSEATIGEVEKASTHDGGGASDDGDVLGIVR